MAKSVTTYEKPLPHISKCNLEFCHVTNVDI